MTFSEFDTSQFPKIMVSLNHLRNRQDFNTFLETWDSFNNNSPSPNSHSAPVSPPLPFYLMFQTGNLSGANLKYCVAMSEFIKTQKKRKKEGTQYLQGSIIIVNSSLTRFFLKIIFLLQRPVADVYLVNNINTAETIYTCLINQQSLSRDWLSSHSSSVVTCEF